MKAAVIIVAIFSLFTFAVKAQELIPATSEDQEMFDQELERAQVEPQKAVKSAAATKERKANFGNMVREEAGKLKAADKSTRKEMGKRVSEQKRKNPGAAAGSATTGTSSSDSDGRNSAPGLNDSGTRGNRPDKNK